MIYSTQHNKNTNEDPKTSVVFENLMLLPDIVFWDILRASASSNRDALPEDAGLMADDFSFWPKWNPNSKYDTGNSNYVEPDVFFRFANIDVIIEAKYSDNRGQYREEWEREFKAYLNEYESDKKKVVLLAVGGNPTFEQEPDLSVGRYKCPVVKYSWVNLLNSVLSYEKDELSSIDDEMQSSMKRIIRNVENGFQIEGIFNYQKKVELKGLSNLYGLGQVFNKSIINETDLYTLSYYNMDMGSDRFGYKFKVQPKNGKEPLWLSIVLWLKLEQITIGAKYQDGWGGELCKLIEKGKSFASEYSEQPDLDDGSYYFYATEKFYMEFQKSETFDAQVDLVARLIDDVCMYYLK